ncbi:MAG: Rne/Rng family ribonuclease [Pseudomonadota bacterium]
MPKKMLIDATHPEETRVVVMDGNKVDDFDFESIAKRQLAGNIYLAKVTRVEPSLQAAFVDYGGNRHGFLAFAEIHPDYYQIPVADREAILAEEEQAERAQAAEAEAEDKSGRRSRRPRKGRSDKTEKADKVESVEAEAKPTEDGEGRSRRRRRGGRSRQDGANGLEVIDLDAAPEATATAQDATETEGSSTPKGLEIHESAPAPEQATPPATESAESDTTAKAEAAPPEVPDLPEVSDLPEVPDPAAQPDPVVAAQMPAPQPEATPEPAPLPEPASDLTEPALPVDTAPTDAAPTDTAPEQAAEPVPGEAAEGPTVTLEIETAAQPDEGDPVPLDTVLTAAEGSEEPADDPAPDEDTPADPTPPRTMSEASGLDEETIAEDVDDTLDTPRPARARGRRRSKSEAAKPDPADDPRDAPKARHDDTPDSEDDSAEAPAAIENAGAEDLREELLRERSIRRRRYRIQDVIKVRQILLVQVVKEERGNKGAALTTYLSLAGRYCVLMPNTARGGGISRKITNAPDRKRLREIVDAFEVPRGMGLIVRTAGAERTRPEIKRDYEFLLRQWEQVRELTLRSIAPCLIYEEGSLIKRSIRDIYSKEIEQVLVEGEGGYREAKDYMKMLMPSHAKNVQQYSDTVPLFIKFQVESFLNAMFSPVVQLKSGGYIVIGITEALVAIDVNSGRSTKEGSIEETALKTNLEASDEVARQLRLRDLAGLIVIDYIDMDEGRNNRAVEKRLKDRLKNDRARIQLGRISAFGLLEMSRQRLRPGMLEASTRPCPHCHGTGMIRSDDSLALAILREAEEVAIQERTAEVSVSAPVGIANYLINRKRAHIARIEERHGVVVTVLGQADLISPEFKLERTKAKPRDAEPLAEPAGRGRAAPGIVEDAEVIEEAQASSETAREGEDGEDGKRRRRGKRGGKRRRGRSGEEGEAPGMEESAAKADSQPSEAQEATAEEDTPLSEGRSGRRSRGGRGRGRGRGSEGEAPESAVALAETPAAEPEPTAEAESVASAPADTPEPDTVEVAVPSDAAQEPETSEVAQETVAEVVNIETGNGTVDHEAAPEVVPAPQPAPETAAGHAPAAIEEIEDPAKPKRKGWWSFGI